ncbi:MAG: ATP-binding protein [Thermodesulfobacteriota bacterium]
MSEALNVLIVDDSERDMTLLQRTLSKRWPELTSRRVDSVESMEKAMEEVGWQIVICDEVMPHFDAVGALNVLRRRQKDIPLIVCSGMLVTEDAIDLMKRGAADFVRKDDLARLVPAVERELAQSESRRQRHLAEELLRSSEAFNRGIIDSSQDCIITLDLEGRLQYMSKGCQCLLEIKHVKDILQTQWVDLWSGEYRQMAEQAIEEALNNGTGQFQGVSATSRGNEQWYDVILSTITDSDGTPENLLVVARDHTKLKQFEEQLIVTEKMSAIAGLAAGIAHELNSPLSAILQSLQLIQMGFDPDEEQNRSLAAEHGLDLEKFQNYLKATELNLFLDGIRTSAASASTIVSKLLQFARPVDQVPSQANLTQLVDCAIGLAKSDYHLKKEYRINEVNFIREYSSESIEINCIPTEIEQVLIHLIKNGCQAMTLEGCKDPRVTIRTKRTENMAVIEVEDNGPGMSQEVSRKAFDPFFSTKEVDEGVGLGLAVSHSIICGKHGGSLNVKSTPGECTVFIIQLPLT